MPTSQKVQIDTYDFGASLTVPTLGALSTGTTITDGTASTCNEQTADSGVYIADFVGADASHLIPAGTYRLRTTVNGKPLKRFVTFTGVDGELVYARSERAAELDSASRLAIWNTLTTETFTADSFGELLLISDGTNGRAVKVTGANHIAADVHDCQADGLSSSTEITAINTFATRMTTGLVQDGAVYQFTANMLELAPSGGGGSSVNVLPATGIVADRSAGATLVPVVGETISQSITLYRTDGTTAISLSGKTLVIVFETLSGVDVATVASGSITISGASSNIVTFAYPSAVTASERTLRFAIRDAAAPSTLYMQGVCSVVRAPQVDA
jgi:hypothetical protein